jgi:hypothetical protein
LRACRLLNKPPKVDDHGMKPSTEQLMRDFLNRLSVAARGKLEFSDRQSLLDRTRARIEAECGDVETATAIQVRKVLAGLGDPVAIVELEQARAGSRVTGESGRASEAGGEPVTAVEAKKNEPASLFAAPDPVGPDPEKKPAESPAASSGSTKRTGSPIRIPRPARDRNAVIRLGGRGPKPKGRGGQASSGVVGFLAGIGTLARQNPQEIIAIVLLGVGGAVFPPIWLLGVAVALPSRKWVIGDKFLGLVAPVILVIVGTVLVLVLGGQHATMLAYIREAWLGAERLSRVAALAGAGYLFWALRRSKRKPKNTPWKLSPRFG